MLCFSHLSRRTGVITKSWTVVLENLPTQKQGPSRAAAFSTSPTFQKTKRYELVVVGGGSAGCATAHMFTRKMGRGKVAVIEPADVSINETYLIMCACACVRLCVCLAPVRRFRR